MQVQAFQGPTPPHCSHNPPRSSAGEGLAKTHTCLSLRITKQSHCQTGVFPLCKWGHSHTSTLTYHVQQCPWVGWGLSEGMRRRKVSSFRSQSVSLPQGPLSLRLNDKPQVCSAWKGGKRNAGQKNRKLLHEGPFVYPVGHHNGKLGRRVEPTQSG